MLCTNYYQRLTLLAGETVVVKSEDQYVAYKIIRNINNESLNEAIVNKKAVEIYRTKMFYNFIDTRNPSTSDDYYIPGLTWFNCNTSETFVLQKERLNNKPIWIGDKGTYISDTTTVIFDIFRDKSAVALYEFNNNLSDTGGKYNLSERGSVTFNQGIYGLAAQFSHRAYCEALTLKNIPTGDGTVSIWIKPKRPSAYYACVWHFSINGNNYFSLWIERSGRPYAIINNRYNLFMPTIQFDRWHHIAITSNSKCYLNGKKVIDHSSNSRYKVNLANTNLPFLVAADRDGIRTINDWYDGLIDELRIFNRNLNDDEIRILYEEGKNVA